MKRFAFGATAVALTLTIMPGQAFAKSSSKTDPAPVSRKVLLMDFTAPPETPIGAAGDAAASHADVAGDMAQAFTDKPAPGDDSTAASLPPAGRSAATLPNPFVTRAVGLVPAIYNSASCGELAYQPDFSHGRGAEERRRMIYPLVQQVACEQGLPIGLFDALIMQESGYNHAAVSRKGALGLAQLMPNTARNLGANPYLIMENLRGGARYLRQQVDRFGRYDLALAAYNAGPERVARYGRIPAIAETVGYVRNISANWGHAASSGLAAITQPSGRRAQLIFMSYIERTAVVPR